MVFQIKWKKKYLKKKYFQLLLSLQLVATFFILNPRLSSVSPTNSCTAQTQERKNGKDANNNRQTKTVNKWGMLTVVTVNQYRSLFSVGICATRLLQMNLCKHQYYFWRWLFLPKLMERHKDAQMKTEQDSFRPMHMKHILQRMQ